jgi:hypothetical protein
MRSPPPDEEYFLMTFFGFLVVGLYFLGKIARRRSVRSHLPSGSVASQRLEPFRYLPLLQLGI